MNNMRTLLRIFAMTPEKNNLPRMLPTPIAAGAPAATIGEMPESTQ